MRRDSIVFGAECECGRKLTCIQTSAVNVVLGENVRHLVREKSGDPVADLERARDHIEREIARLKS